MTKEIFLKEVDKRKDDPFSLNDFLKETAETTKMPLSQLRSICDAYLKQQNQQNQQKEQNGEAEKAIFVQNLKEDAKKGIVANIPLFFNFKAGKYLFEKDEKKYDSMGKEEKYTQIDYIDAFSVKKMILEFGKAKIGEILDDRTISDIVKWIPSYFKSYNPLEKNLISVPGSPLLTKNMCQLPPHFLSFKNELKDKNFDLDKIIEKIKKDTPNIYLLLQNLFVKEEYIRYFLNWLSFIVQTHQKTRNAVVLVGDQGTGKGVFWENIIKWIFGYRNCVVVSNADLRSQFNVVFDNKLFVCFNEIKADFNERNTIYETLKQYVSDDSFMVNVKNVSQYEVNNFFNCIFFSNHEVPLQIEGTDRRYSVFKTSAKKLKDLVGDTSLFVSKIKDEREVFLKCLFSLKIDRLYAQNLIETDQKKKIKELSNTKQDVLKSKIKDGDFDFFEKIFDDFFEEEEENEKMIDTVTFDETGDKKVIYFKHTNQEMKKEFLINLHFKVFSNEVLRWFYKIYVDENKAKRDIFRFFKNIFDDGYRVGKNRINIKYFNDAEKAVIWGKIFVKNGEKWENGGDALDVVYEDKDGRIIDENLEEIPF